LMNEAKLRDPGGFRDDRRLGEWWFARWLKTANIDDAKKAVTAFKQAWNRYPTNAALMAEMAMAMVASKSDAHEVARKAMEQDAINRDRGHIDRFLDEATRRKLEELLDGPIEQRPSHH
jgi:thioredoxin-like negative regulator of GroEL